jgi:NAD(P)-dependent dehydrogenase (short-subunit alcohol dehydrogenase family)
MAGRLSGKRAVVFGGGTGIGLACARAMAREGAAVFLTGRREHVLKEAAAGIAPFGKVSYHAGDATVAKDVEEAAARAATFLGGIDTVLVSAGTSGRTAIHDTSPEEFQRISDHNIRPVFLASRHCVPFMLQEKSGSIIAISSMFGIVGRAERVAYCTAKAGVIGMMRAVALDLADKGLRANAICPGFIETDLAREIAAQEADPEAALRDRRLMHPIPRAGQPDEVAAMAVFLSSDESAFVTGQALSVDGGYSIR